MSKIRFHILLAALLVVTGCGEDDKVLPEQQQQFESFLSGSHQPRLVTAVSYTHLTLPTKV